MGSLQFQMQVHHFHGDSLYMKDPHPEVLGPLGPLVPQELQIFLPVAALYQHRLCLYRFQHASIREARQTRAVAVDVFFMATPTANFCHFQQVLLQNNG